MIKNATDCGAAARRSAEGDATTLESCFWMFGEYDGFAILEGPDPVSAGPRSIASASTGASSRTVTVQLSDADDQAAFLGKAKTELSSYAPPTG